MKALFAKPFANGTAAEMLQTAGAVGHGKERLVERPVHLERKAGERQLVHVAPTLVLLLAGSHSRPFPGHPTAGSHMTGRSPALQEASSSRRVCTLSCGGPGNSVLGDFRKHVISFSSALPRFFAQLLISHVHRAPVNEI